MGLGHYDEFSRQLPGAIGQYFSFLPSPYYIATLIKLSG